MRKRKEVDLLRGAKRRMLDHLELEPVSPDAGALLAVRQG